MDQLAIRVPRLACASRLSEEEDVRMHSLPRLEHPDLVWLHSVLSLGFIVQVVPGHVQGGHLQLPLLVRAHHHLHHWDDPYQHLLHGLPGGLLLFPALWGRLAAETHQEHPALLGLADRLQRLRDHNEKHTVCKWLVPCNTFAVPASEQMTHSVVTESPQPVMLLS